MLGQRVRKIKNFGLGMGRQVVDHAQKKDVNTRNMGLSRNYSTNLRNVSSNEGKELTWIFGIYLSFL